MKNVVIIGNGIAGVTAARYIRKLSDRPITIISAESEHFFSRTALMYVYMGHMRWKDIKPYEDFFWEKNRINLIQAYVEKVDTAKKNLVLSSGKNVLYDDLILATGSAPNKFGWKGQDLAGVGGLYSKQDLEYMESYTHDAKRGVIVGGGLIGIEMAEMMLSRGIEVTMLVREKSYWDNVLPKEESQMVNRHIREHHIDLRLETELAEILPDENGRARAVRTNTGEEIECQWVGLTAGVHPNISFLKGSEIETQRGIMVDEYFQTNIPHVYAIGDCAQFRTPVAGRRPIEQIWYTGKIMGEIIALTLTGKKTAYDPGIFFNSAKFFDLEYQIYGDIESEFYGEEAVHNPKGIETLYWQHPKAHKAIRIDYHKETGAVFGFHLMGIRYRHKVCEKWIADETHIEEVIRDLAAANYDPEFYARHERDFADLYFQKTGKRIQQKSKKSLWKFIFGLQRKEVKVAQ